MRVPASLLGLLGLCASAATALAAPLASLPFERPCRYGWRGPSCDERAFPACVLDGVHADCTFTHTCACFRQCDAAEMLTMQARLCYDSNASSLAEVVRSPLVAYRRLRHIPGFPHRAGAYGDCADCGMASGRPLDGEPPEEDVLLPTSSCPKGCSGRGSCSALADAGSLPGAVGTCVCWANQDHEPRFDRTFNGGACEGALVPKLCPGGCGGDGRGACVNGVCECGAGFFGTDCAQPDAGRVPTARPSIYLYDLPPGFSAWREQVAMNRNIGLLLYDRLLRSSQRTLDPDTADYFFVPVFPNGAPWSTSAGRVLEAMHYVRSTWPWFNATRGHNHLVAFGYDFGGCEVSGEAVFFDRIRMISHFGLTEQYLNRFRYCVGPGRGPSYRPSVDLVVPDTMEMPDKMLTPFGYTATGATPPHARTMRFFFAGSRTGPWRERLFDRHGGQEKKGIHLYSSLVSLGEKMRKAQFCADVGAAGFSTRFTLAVVSGCVPLYLKELAQPWDGVLDHSAFSIGLTPDEYITNLTAVLDAVTPERLAQLQAGVAAVWRRFVWSSFSTWGGPGGPCSGLPCSGPVADEGPDGDAYDLLMEVLDRMHREEQAALRGGAG